MTTKNVSIKKVSVDYDPFADAPLTSTLESTAAQREIWSSVQMDEHASCAFNESICLHFTGSLNQEALKTALVEIVKRHEALRSTFSKDGQQSLIQPSLEVEVRTSSLDIDYEIRQEAMQSFNLETGPLFRFVMVVSSNENSTLILTAHHIICDGWSLAILVQDLEIFYNRALDVPAADLPEVVGFSDYAKEMQNQPSDESFWLMQFEPAVPSYDLPVDFSRPVMRRFESERIDFDVDLTLVQSTKEQANRLGVSHTAYLMAAFQLCLFRWTQESHLAVGIPTAGQATSGPESLVGHCVNMLPIIGQIDDDLTFSVLTKQISDRILDAIEHRNFTYGSLVEKLSLPRDPTRLPILSVLFNVDQGIQGRDLNFFGLTTEFASNPRYFENFEIFINASDYGDRFTIECQYHTSLFTEQTMQSRLQEYVLVLEQLVNNSESPVGSVDLVRSDECHALIARGVGPVLPLPEQSLIDTVLKHAESRKDSIAVVCGEESLTYGELLTRTRRLAHFLQSQSIQSGDRIGVCLQRSTDMLVALLGVWQAGAAYVPLDPDFPEDRLQYMTDDAGLTRVLCDAQTQPLMESVPTQWRMDQLTETLREQPATPVAVTIEPTQAAYIIYTSGSTGRPKGVELPQRAVLNFLHSMAQTPGLTQDDRLLAVTTLSFDIAVLELYLPLYVGGQVVIASRDDAMDGRRLMHQLQQHRITTMQATPSTWRLLLGSGWQGEQPLKALCGGEALPKDLAADLLPTVSSLWNLYGPTETTVWSSCAEVTLQDIEQPQPLSIGQAIGNTQLYVLDTQLQPVPQCVAGELLIGGDGVAAGYVGRPNLTADRFIDCPADLSPGQGKLYRTGDKVRYRYDGELEYLGRMDQQVKVRGYRIELGEIETQLRAHEQIDDCAVAVKEERAGDTRLIAYVVWQGNALTMTEVRNFLKETLPSYMVPQHLETLKALPRTLNGKLDRNALASLSLSEEGGQAHRDLVEPANDIERTLLSIWQDVLGTQLISTSDSFFDLGGHSLLIAKVIQAVDIQLNSQIQFRDFYTAPTIGELATLISSQSLEGTQLVIESQPAGEPCQLSLAQQRLWFLNKMEGDTTVFNLPSGFRLLGPLNIDALNRAITSMIERHGTLRTRIIETGNAPYQILEPPYSFEIEIIDLSSEADAETVLKKTLLRLQDQLFQIHDFPLFKMHLIRMSDEDHVLFFMPHHLIFDGWSFDLFVHEITTLYSLNIGIAKPSLPELPIQYRDYAHWMRERLEEEKNHQQINYWAEQLQGTLPVLEFPTDTLRPDTARHEGEQVLFELNEPLVKRLTELALKSNSSLFMVLLSSYLLLLYRYTDQEDLIVGVPMADRSRAGTEHLIGFFVNALVLRFSVNKAMTFLELLDQVKEKCLSGFEMQDAPFEKLVEVLNPPRDLSRTPLFQTSLTYQDVSNREITMGDLDFLQVEIPTQDSPLDFNLWFKKRGSQLSAALVYSTSLFHKSTMSQLASHYIKLLEEMVNNVHAQVGQYPILSNSELTQLIERGVGPVLPLPEQSLIDTVLQHTESRQDSIAVVCAEESLTYGELLTRTRQLAHYLQSKSVQSGDRIGVCLQRSTDMLVALLGVWQAGAAYVPLDPDFPEDRLQYMMDDAGLTSVLCDAQTQPLMQSVPTQWRMDQLREILNEQPATPVAVTIEPTQAAYIIYTSGSTGRPKGVELPQRAVLNFLHSMAQTPGLSQDDCLLAVTTLSFDIAVLELYLPLYVGGQVVIASREDAMDGRRLMHQLQQHQITTMQATPATWRLLLGSGWQGEQPLKALCGGEALPKDLAADLLPTVSSLWNLYGPTETTVWSSCAEVILQDAEQSQPLSIGRAIGNTQLYVLDSQLQPVPQCVAGELLIGGEGVAAGYVGRPNLTADRFIDCPADLGPGQGKLYRTGDKVRYRNDGQLEYLGRMDQQVKVRGYRIELGEIESQLRAHEQIEDCAVAVKEERAGDTRLIAYVVWQGGALTMTEVRNFLKETLPSYMVPQHLETLRALPRTLNGKLDRKALASLTQPRATIDQNEPPLTETEIQLAEIWKEVVGSVTVARFDNFFDIGGHSLLSMRVIQTVRDAWGVEMSPRDLLLESLTENARRIDEQKPSEQVINQTEKTESKNRGFFSRLLNRNSS